MLDYFRGKPVTLPLWARILVLVDHDPLRAQEVDRDLREVPQDALEMLLAMARGNPLRAREIYLKLNKTWWRRWMMMARARTRVNTPDGRS